MQLILIRHGLPIRSAETSDPPLSEAGHEQARRTAAALAGERIDAVYASTMRRAMQTAEPYAARNGHALGTHEAMSPDELSSMFPGVPHEHCLVHDFRTSVTTLGEVPGSVPETKLAWLDASRVATHLAALPAAANEGTIDHGASDHH